jgi:hypothetical protein
MFLIFIIRFPGTNKVFKQESDLSCLSKCIWGRVADAGRVLQGVFVDVPFCGGMNHVSVY